MKIAASTDFYTCEREIPQIIPAMAEAGFTHLHWCHHWGDDYFYEKEELKEIRNILHDTSMELLDVHGSDCVSGMCYYSEDEESRKRGIKLVCNRLEMMDFLEATGALMMHVPFQRCRSAENPEMQNKKALLQADALRRSLDELMPELEKFHRPVAIENMWGDTWGLLEAFFAAYPAEYLGLCYDSGHANFTGAPGVDGFERNKKRLQALHLHDNDGHSDQHQPPFYGTVDWERIAGIIGSSGYSRAVSFEMSMKATPFAATPGTTPPPEQIRSYLRDTYQRCAKVVEAVEKIRTAKVQQEK